MKGLDMHPNLRRAHDACWKRFFEIRAKLVYDFAFSDDSQFPTPGEVANDLPTWKGAGSGMEDCCLQGGWILDGLLTAYRVTGDEEWAAKARDIAQGLIECGTISPVRGLLARGFAPGRKDFYRSTSADMYASFFYAMWRYTQSPLASEGQKNVIARIFCDAAELISSFDHDIPTLDMKPNLYGDISAVCPGRACRTLQVYRAAAVLTGERRWDSLYRRMLGENCRVRLFAYYGPEPISPKIGQWGVFQSQAAIRQLYELEDDHEIRDIYRQSLNDQAEGLIHRVGTWRETCAKPGGRMNPCRWREKVYAGEKAHLKPDYREGSYEYKAMPGAEIQCLATVLLCEDDPLKKRAAEIGWPMLAEADLTMPQAAHSIKCLDFAYWRGVELGLFPLS